MSFDPKDFRRALGKFATGVTVVTALDENGEKIGVTASSFNTVSIEPPLILWSIDKSAYSANIYTQGEYFAVNVLKSDQMDISNRFARRGEDKFADVDVKEGFGGVPVIAGASAQFECRTWSVYDGGDHHIIVGEVIDYRYQDNVNSLAFHNGRYAVPELHPAMKETNVDLCTGGVLDNHLIYLLRQALSAYTNNFYPKLSDFGITAEEWRILTLLADRGDMPLHEIGPRVSQASFQLADTVEWLKEKGYVEIDWQKDSNLSLTASGLELSGRLLDMALGYEANSLKNKDVDSLKISLREIATSLS